MKDFIKMNWVFISGLLVAVTLVLQQFAVASEWTYTGLLIALGLAVLSYLANEWRGKGVTITGIIGTAAYVFITVYDGGAINWKQFGLLLMINILTAVAPPPKPASYEAGSPR